MYVLFESKDSIFYTINVDPSTDTDEIKRQIAERVAPVAKAMNTTIKRMRMS